MPETQTTRWQHFKSWMRRLICHERLQDGRLDMQLTRIAALEQRLGNLERAYNEHPVVRKP